MKKQFTDDDSAKCSIPFKDVIDEKVYQALLLMTDCYKDDNGVKEFFDLLNGSRIYSYDMPFTIIIGNSRYLVQKHKNDFTPYESPEFYLEIHLTKRLFSLFVLITNRKGKYSIDSFKYTIDLDEKQTNDLMNLEFITAQFCKLISKSQRFNFECNIN